jgi:hypothetical protein
MSTNVIPFRKKPANFRGILEANKAEFFAIGELGIIGYEILSSFSEEDIALYVAVEQKVAEQMAERRRAGARKAAATRKRRREEQKASEGAA